MAGFVNSVPKSGTNLVHKALELLGCRYAKLGIADTLVRGSYPLARRAIRNNPFDYSKYSIGLYGDAEVGSLWLNTRLRNLRSRDFVTGHCAYSDKMLDSLRQFNVRPIVVLRDPRDVLISHLNYFPSRKDIFYAKYLVGKFSEDYSTVMNGFSVGGSKIYSFRAAYERYIPWYRKCAGNVVRFESLVGESGGGSRCEQLAEIQKLVHISGIETTPAEIQNIAQSLFGGTPTFAKGQAYGWKTNEEFLNKLDDFNAQMGDILELLDYSKL